MSVRYHPDFDGVFVDDSLKIRPKISEDNPSYCKSNGQRIYRSLSSSDLTKYHHRHPCKSGCEKFGGTDGNELSPGTTGSRQETCKPKGSKRSVSESRSYDRNNESKVTANCIDEPGDICRERGSGEEEPGEWECWRVQEPSRIKGAFERSTVSRKDECGKRQLDENKNCSRTVEESSRIEPNVPTGIVDKIAISGKGEYAQSDQQELSVCNGDLKTAVTERTQKIPESNVPVVKIDCPEILVEGKSNQQEELGEYTAGETEINTKSIKPVDKIRSSKTGTKSKYQELDKKEVDEYKFPNTTTKDRSSRSKETKTNRLEESFFTSEIDRELNTCRIYGTLDDFSKYLSEYGRKHKSKSRYVDVYENYKMLPPPAAAIALNRTYLEPSKPTGFAYRRNSDSGVKNKCIVNRKGIDETCPNFSSFL